MEGEFKTGTVIDVGGTLCVPITMETRRDTLYCGLKKGDKVKIETTRSYLKYTKLEE